MSNTSRDKLCCEFCVNYDPHWMVCENDADEDGCYVRQRDHFDFCDEYMSEKDYQIFLAELSEPCELLNEEEDFA